MTFESPNASIYFNMLNIKLDEDLFLMGTFFPVSSFFPGVRLLENCKMI